MVYTYISRHCAGRCVRIGGITHEVQSRNVRGEKPGVSMAFSNGHGSLSALNYGTRRRCRCAASKRDVRDLVGMWRCGNSVSGGILRERSGSMCWVSERDWEL